MVVVVVLGYVKLPLTKNNIGNLKCEEGGMGGGVDTRNLWGKASEMSTNFLCLLKFIL